MITSAEIRLGVTFDWAYRRLMLRCNGIENLGDIELYPVDELGVSERWWANDQTLWSEYFDWHSAFETRGSEIIEPEFDPPPPGRKHVLIGYSSLNPTTYVCNFAQSDQDAAPGEVADCRYEPALLGTINDALSGWVSLIDGPENEEFGPSYAHPNDQLHGLLTAAKTATLAPARYAVSQRWRDELDALSPVDAIHALRAAVVHYHVPPNYVSFDPDTRRFIAEFEYQGQTIVPNIAVVHEEQVWRIDSISWL